MTDRAEDRAKEQDSGQGGLERAAAGRALADALYAQGLIGQGGYRAALEMSVPPRRWSVWIARLFIVTGSALILAGIISFFAYNWDTLSAFAKFGVLAGAMGLCLVAAVLLPLNRLPSQILLLSAFVLLGIFWAVFGQIYQTGADAYSLFMLWAAMGFVWVLISNFAPTWAAWLVVANLFLYFYWEQAVMADYPADYLLSLILVAFNGLFLGLREGAAARGIPWLDQRWHRIALAAAVLYWAALPVFALIDRFERAVLGETLAVPLILSAAGGAVAIMLIFWTYRTRIRDMAVLALAVFTVCIVAEVLIFNLLQDAFEVEHDLGLILLGLSTVLVFGAAVFYLQRTVRAWGDRHGA